ncbi:MAG: hypothetical protein ACTSPA_08655 [Promethearchaeota archaeon]
MARYDGMHAKDLPIVKNLIPIIMTSRAVNTADYLTQFDLSKTLPYIEKFNENLYKQGYERKRSLEIFSCISLCHSKNFISSSSNESLYFRSTLLPKKSTSTNFCGKKRA